MDSRFRGTDTLGSMKALPGGAWKLPHGRALPESRTGTGLQLDPVKYQNCLREEPEVRGGLGL